MRRDRGSAAVADRTPEESVATSELGRVEVLRAARKVSVEAVAEARAIVGDLDLVPLSRAVQDLAGDVGDPLLRTLDALHLASALLLGDALTTFVAYDRARYSGSVRRHGGRYAGASTSD